MLMSSVLWESDEEREFGFGEFAVLVIGVRVIIGGGGFIRTVCLFSNYSSFFIVHGYFPLLCLGIKGLDKTSLFVVFI